MAHVVFAAREPGDPNYDESSYSRDNPEGASLAYGANVLWQHVDCAEFIILTAMGTACAGCVRRLRLPWSLPSSTFSILAGQGRPREQAQEGQGQRLRRFQRRDLR